jgi:voltage-gated potassium channel
MSELQHGKITAWQFVILVLSIYVLAALLIESFFPLAGEVAKLLDAVDFVVCGFFGVDFLLQLRAAKRKTRYFFTWGWIDLISSIPSISFFRVGRLVRVIRILRLLRGMRSTRLIIAHLFANRARGTLATVSLITFVLIVFSSVVVLSIETAPESNIKTAGDALWWSIATITTVGYGDVYPVTTLGRFVGAAMMISGIAMFGVFTATVASVFINKGEKHDEVRPEQLLSQLDDISKRLSRIERALDAKTQERDIR